MDEPWGHYAKWSQPITRQETLWDSSHRRSLEENGDCLGQGELVFNGEKVSVRDDGKNSGDAWWRHTQFVRLQMVNMVNFLLHVFYHNQKRFRGASSILGSAWTKPTALFVCLYHLQSDSQLTCAHGKQTHLTSLNSGNLDSTLILFGRWLSAWVRADWEILALSQSHCFLKSLVFLRPIIMFASRVPRNFLFLISKEHPTIIMMICGGQAKCRQEADALWKLGLTCWHWHPGGRSTWGL